MIVSDTAIKNRISVMVLAVIILTVGVYCYMALPRENEPDITIPNVFVTTSYKGVSSEDIETSITIKIENKLKGLDRVKKIHSISSEGLSQINIEFIPGTDIDEVLQKVKAVPFAGLLVIVGAAFPRDRTPVVEPSGAGPSFRFRHPR